MKLFIDDVRNAPDDSWHRTYSYDDTVKFIMNNGMPNFISFDHDLGISKTGYDICHWIVEADLDGIIEIPDDFDFKVHSDNPIGSQNIKNLMNNYLKYRN